MNKKFMTLGLAAAVGLAGLVALPVVAASTFKIKTGEPVVKKVGDQYAAVTPVSYTGVLKVDGTAVSKDDLFDYLNGKDAVALNLQATEKLAKDNPTDGKLEAKKTVLIEGTYAHIKTELEALANHVDDTKAKRDALKLTNVEIKASDNLTFTAAGLYNDLKAFIDDEKFENAKFKLVLNDAQMKTLDLSAGAASVIPAELKGKVEISKAKLVKFENTEAKNKIVEAFKVSYDAALVDGQLEKAPEVEKPQVEQDNKEKENAGNTQGAAPQTTPKTPNTGIAE